MSWVNVPGYAASLAVLAMFCMSTMVPLRTVALASSALFRACGYLDHLYPVGFLHAALIPVNLWRLTQFQRLVRDMRDAHRRDLTLKHLMPHMKMRHLAARIGPPWRSRCKRLRAAAHGERDAAGAA